MKRSLAAALTSAVVIGTAATTFAAANPFEDVPSDHWAYDAIAQLAADGIIEGYGDGTYRGDQEITRYEMAQMVARAMAKGTTGGDKALVDKLAAEFADELNGLGVRVAALEKKVDNVKWNGTVRYRYITAYDDISAEMQNYIRKVTGSSANKRESWQYVTLRLEPEIRINQHWTGHARIDYDTDMNSATNASNFDQEEEGAGGFQMERAWVQGDYKDFQVLLGKLPYISIVDNGMFFDDNVAGGQLTVGNKVKATLTVGRTDNVGKFADYNPDYSSTGSYQAIEIYNDRNEKITWGVGYHHVKNKAVFNAAFDNDSKNALNVWDVGLGWSFAKHFNLNAAYAWNPAGEADRCHETKSAWSVELDYKGADPSDPGSWGAFVAYRKLGVLSVLVPTYDTMTPGTKGIEIGLDIVPMKNVQTTFKYFHGKMIPQGSENVNSNVFFTELNFFF